jgi:hypothetical protein
MKSNNNCFRQLKQVLKKRKTFLSLRHGHIVTWLTASLSESSWILFSTYDRKQLDHARAVFEDIGHVLPKTAYSYHRQTIGCSKHGKNWKQTIHLSSSETTHLMMLWHADALLGNDKTTIMGSVNRHKRNNWKQQQRNGVSYAVPAKQLYPCEL